MRKVLDGSPFAIRLSSSALFVITKKNRGDSIRASPLTVIGTGPPAKTTTALPFAPGRTRK